MNTTRHFRISFLAMFFLSLVVVLTSCSKKEVVQDEPLMSPTEETEGAMMESEGEVGMDDGMMAEGESMDAGAMDSGMMENTGAELRTVFFDFDRYSLSSEARDILQGNADWMKANPTATVQIEGHCDERGTIEYNLALGERRANAVRNYIVNLGVDESRLSTISYGEERPTNPGHDDGAWAENRRSEFVVLSQ